MCFTEYLYYVCLKLRCWSHGYGCLKHRQTSQGIIDLFRQSGCKSDCQYLARHRRSEEHTSELQSRFDLVCRLLLEKKKKKEDLDRDLYDRGVNQRQDVNAEE